MVGRRMRTVVIRLLLLVSVPAALLAVFGSPAAAGSGARAAAPAAGAVKASSLGTYSPTFVGPAATGCDSGCNLLSGPYLTPSTAGVRGVQPHSAVNLPDSPRALPAPRPHGSSVTSNGAGVQIPTVSCVPLGPGCDTISSDAGGAVGVKGLNAVDSATHTNNPFKDVEPPDQGLCAGNGYAVETNNIGEIQIFNRNLSTKSPPISLDTVMGLTPRGWSSGGDPMCQYDSSNGGHWFFTEIVSASPEKAGGAFVGCFAAVANSCFEGIAVTDGASPYGPYHVYFLNANYNPAEPGVPYELNDYAKTATTRDAFLMFYDEFPLRGGGIAGGFFNGAQQFAFNKNALELGLPVRLPSGAPNPAFTVAHMNMGLVPTPDGTCASDDRFGQPGYTCWYQMIPAEPAGPAEWDNSHGGSGFMAATFDYYGLGDNQMAVWAWTGLNRLNSPGCSSCGGIKFSGTLFSNVEDYVSKGINSATGFIAPQKIGPIPLGDECGKAGLSIDNVAHCPENGIETNNDNVMQVSEAQGQIWFGVNTELMQLYSSPVDPNELHQGVAYWVVSTNAFDNTGNFSLTSQGYVSPAHEDLEFPAIAAQGNRLEGGTGKAVMAFTLSGNGGPTGADNGGFYPSTAYGRLTSSSSGLLGSQINVADLGQAPEDGFTEYQGYPGPTRPRWGDYSMAIFMPNSGGRVYFATNYIQYPNCVPPAFTLTIGTCGGTRDGNANWGTSVNYVVP